MPTSAGPNISGEENLVFGFDLKDQKNSYLGEPTTNLATDSPSMGGWPGSFTVVNSATKTFDFTTSSIEWGGEASWTTFYYDVSAYTGQYISISATYEVAYETNGKFSFLMIGQTIAGQTYLGYSAVPDRNEKSTKTREKISWSGVIGDGGKVGILIWMNNGSGGPSGNLTVRFSNVQVERKSHPTPFTSSSRSNTQGLLDLSNNSTINISGVSFDSNAQMFFDGTDDWLNASIALNSGNFTYETVMSSNSTTYGIFSAGFGTPIIGGGTTIQSYITASGAVINLYAPIGAGGWVYGSTSNVSGYVSVSNRLRHIVVTNNGVSWKTYVDGTLVGDVNFYQPNTGTEVGIARLAMQGFGNISSDVKMVKLYNRILTDTEVLNNYNNIKRKYGI